MVFPKFVNKKSSDVLHYPVPFMFQMWEVPEAMTLTVVCWPFAEPEKHFKSTITI